jgi:hypothetical protein
MNFIAFAIMAAAWLSFFLAPASAPSRLIQFLVFGPLAALMIFFGGMAYWWDSSMRPDQASSFIFVCGIFTLASQAVTILRGVLENEGPMPWPERRKKR